MALKFFNFAVPSYTIADTSTPVQAVAIAVPVAVVLASVGVVVTVIIICICWRKRKSSGEEKGEGLRDSGGSRDRGWGGAEG